MINNDKYSNLLWYILKYGRKIFYTIDALVEKDKGNPGSKY
jgi:hypothetical protein